jgi:plasmid stabilization system protein ParE
LVYVIWTDEAINDLRQIKEYIERDSPENAQRFCRELLRAPDRLKKFPRSGEVVPEFGREALRQVLCGDYRLLYEVAQGACYIRAVIHGRRDLQRHIDPSNWDLH